MAKTGSSVYFSTVETVSETVDSVWRSNRHDHQKAAECQTPDAMYEFDEAETQTAMSVAAETQFPEADREKVGRNVARGGVKVVGDFDAEQRDDAYAPSMVTFLRRAYKTFVRELEDNVTSKAFDGYDVTVVDPHGDVAYWRTLSVDLERKKVVFPDWATAKHFPGVIVRCSVTRNKERLYDIDYDDGQRLQGVREEHIRWVSAGDAAGGGGGGGDDGRPGPKGRAGAGSSSSSSSSSSAANKKAGLAARLQEGVRVHAKVQRKGGREVFVPGRIVKVQRGNTFDVEVRGAQ
jgi:hypothetical protein